MVTGVAFCPQAPVLVPRVARAAAVELTDLRAACRTAIRRIVGMETTIVVVGAGPAWLRYEPTARGTLAAFGVDLDVSLGSDDRGPDDPDSAELPLALTIAAWLLRDTLGPGCGAVGYGVGTGDGHLRLPPGGDVALLVMGDGSACRSRKAPGYLDERAEPFDAGVAAALGCGDAAALAGLDAGVGGDLLAAGVPAWRAVAVGLAGGEWDAELIYDQAPYGVGYFVAAWTAARG